MTNDEMPISKIGTFIEKAKAVGIYNPSQGTNLAQALKLAVDQAKASKTDVSKLTVGEAAARVPGWLDDYGGQNKASVQSIATYKGRAKKLLDDFKKWNDGDFMEWKKALAKTPKPTKRPKVKEPDAPNGTQQPPAGEQVHVLRLPGGKAGKLILPNPIGARDIAAAWKQLDAYRALLQTQAEIEDDSEDEGAEIE